MIWGGVFHSVQECRGLSLRFYLTLDELHTAARHRKWDITSAKPCANGVGGSNRSNDIYEVHDIYIRYDIDEDGYDEDLVALS